MATISKRLMRKPMPIVSTFFGIIIRMYYGDHPPPHFHAEYQGQRAIFDFNGTLLAGSIKSATARRLIKMWCKRHNEELIVNWARIEEGQVINRIDSLE